MSKQKIIKLSDYLHPEMVWLDVPDEPIEFIGRKFAEMTFSLLKCPPDQKDEIVRKLSDSVIERQQLGTTGIGIGILWLESGIIEEKWMEQIYLLGIGISRKGICWRFSGPPSERSMTYDEKPVHIIAYEIGGTNFIDFNPFIAVYPKGMRLLKDKQVREALLACNTPEEVISVIRAEDDY